MTHNGLQTVVRHCLPAACGPPFVST